MANKTSGLGKGFAALLPQDFNKDLLSDGERIIQLSLTDITANKDQPRRSFDEHALKELAASLKQYGVLQPLVVTKKNSTYEIIAGERRFRAAHIAGLAKVPVIVRSVRDLEQLEIALVENVQRVDLSPLDQAVSIERLHQQFSMTYEAIAGRLGKANTTIVNIVRLLQLPPRARDALSEKKITEGHARQILALKDLPLKQEELLAAIIKYGWSVREAERFVTSIKQGHKKPLETKARMATQTPETKQLSERVGLPVAIRRTAKGGKLEISFGSDAELQSIFTKL